MSKVVDVMSSEDAKGMEVEHEHLPTYKKLEGYVRRHGHLPPMRDFFQCIVDDHHKEDPEYYAHNPDI